MSDKIIEDMKNGTVGLLKLDNGNDYQRQILKSTLKSFGLTQYTVIIDYYTDDQSDYDIYRYETMIEYIIGEDLIVTWDLSWQEGGFWVTFYHVSNGDIFGKFVITEEQVHNLLDLVTNNKFKISYG